MDPCPDNSTERLVRAILVFLDAQNSESTSAHQTSVVLKITVASTGILLPLASLQRSACSRSLLPASPSSKVLLQQAQGDSRHRKLQSDTSPDIVAQDSTHRNCGLRPQPKCLSLSFPVSGGSDCSNTIDSPKLPLVPTTSICLSLIWKTHSSFTILIHLAKEMYKEH
jgi:hypothetical protein